MKPTTDTRDQKIVQLNKAKQELTDYLTAYNQQIHQAWQMHKSSAQEPEVQPLSHESQQKSTLFKTKIENPLVTELSQKIAQKRAEVQALEVEIFGKSNPDSPSFLLRAK